MLWDVSWDQNNVINGQRYSDYAFKELGGVTEPPTVTIQVPPRPPPPPPPPLPQSQLTILVSQ